MLWRRVNFCEGPPGLRPGITSLTGGGGKTTLLYSLSNYLAKSGQRVLCTTTTRMCRPDLDGGRIPFLPCANPLEIVLPPSGTVLAAREAPPDGDPAKIFGYEPGDVDAMFLRGVAPWIIVEADGSARMPLKAPADHEPVIPSLSTTVIAVVGLSCMAAPLSRDTVFRMDRICDVTDLAPGDPVTPAAVAILATHPRGLFKGTPPGASRLLFCNQADLPETLEAGKAIGEILAKEHAEPPRIFLGSLQKDGLSCLTPGTE